MPLLFVGRNTSIVGMVVHLLRDVGKVYSELLLLPRIWTLSSSDHVDSKWSNRWTDNSATASESAEQRSRSGSDSSQTTTPGYRDFTWNYDNLSQLPEDGNVFDQLNIHEAEESGGLAADFGPIEEPEENREVVNEAAVPNMLVHDSELNQLKGRINDGVEADEQVPL
ncbi:hypothetical protein N657DRAFT_651228 [Parathielavia appendiculata]|uniref:Uncharacterized protein n=1 Tax=Parathielavia appendiculata TaxID=2587402 RepID=A0AAN6TPU7_9PEZI|nr:hypothetical protein N657DRAFT_651228 [Parathielavia appendiculata]